MGHESVAGPEAGVGVGLVTAAVDVADCAGALVAGAEPPLALPQPAAASERRNAGTAATVSR